MPSKERKKPMPIYTLYYIKAKKSIEKSKTVE